MFRVATFSTWHQASKAAARASRRCAGTKSIAEGCMPDIVIQPSKPHTATVLFLHGLGDTGYGWQDAFEAIKHLLPYTKFILPSAPMQPVTLNMGMTMPSWFDIRSLNDVVDDPHTGLDDAVGRMHAMLDLETDEHKIPASRIVFGGFSQGGSVALYGGYKYHAELAGILGLSTWLPRIQEWPEDTTAAAQATPFFMCHGEDDDVVQFKYGERSFEALQGSGRTGEFTPFPRLGHSLNMDELRAVAAWLQQRLPE